MSLEKLLRPGLHFALMRHDDHCQAQESQSALDCTCGAELEIVDEAQFLSAVGQTRQQRRRAEREAAKAMRKAKRPG